MTNNLRALELIVIHRSAESARSVRAFESNDNLYLDLSTPVSCGDSIELNGVRRNVDLVFIEPDALRVVLGRQIEVR